MTDTAVEKTLAVLEALADHSRLTDIARVTGLPKSTVHRLLGTLAELDIVCHDGSRYHMNMRWQRFSGDQFTAPIVNRDGDQLAGLTLRTRGPVSSDVAADRLRRLVADLAAAVSRQIHAS